METAKFLRKIKGVCKEHETCKDCPLLNKMICGAIPGHWSDSKIEDMAKAIDSYKEEEGENE